MKKLILYISIANIVCVLVFCDEITTVKNVEEKEESSTVTASDGNQIDDEIKNDEANINTISGRDCDNKEGFTTVYTSKWKRPTFRTTYMESTRVTQFETQVIDQVCLLEPEHGPCRGEIEMYFFNVEKMDCDRFLWGGCQGNGNRFDKYIDCNSTCLSYRGYKKGRPRFCHLTFDYGWCFGSETRWYYDTQWKICKKAIYSGCGGNKNNFYNEEQCVNVCGFGLPALTTKKPINRDGNYKRIIVNPENL